MASSGNNIIYGGEMPRDEIEDYISLGDFALKRLKSNGDNVPLFDADTKEGFKSSRLHDLVMQCCLSLRELNVQTGDIVGICSENRFEYIVVAWSVICLNATIAPFSLSYTERELDHALSISKPRIVFTSLLGLKRIQPSDHNSKKFIQTIVLFESTKVKEYQKNILLWNNFLHPSVVRSAESFQPQSVDDEQTALILCSSGTTGLPKGVELTHKNLKIVIGGAVAELNLMPQIGLSIVPFSHSYGLFVALFFSMATNSKLVFSRKFEEHAYLKNIQDYRVNVCFAVPALVVMFAKSPAVENYDLSSLVGISCGAAPLRKETIEAVLARLGQHLRIGQGYGMSESTLAVIKHSRDSPIKHGSVGKVAAGVYCKVIDDSGSALGAYQRGELCFKCPTVMKGYLGDKEATAATIDSEGWLHTGDIGYYDEDLDFFIVDRLKELIKYKGFQVPPAELEGLLLTHPKIKDAGVTAQSDEAAGELPTAFVVKEPGVQLTEKEVIDFIAQKVSSPKRLRGGVRFVSEIPKNTSGKILRRVLKEMLVQDSSKSKL